MSSFVTGNQFLPGSTCASCGFSVHGPTHYRRCILHKAAPRTCLCSHAEERHMKLSPRGCRDCNCGVFTAMSAQWPENRIVPADSPLPSLSDGLPPVTPLGALIDRINQKLQVLMVHVDGNDKAESTIRVIAQELRQHYRDEYGGAVDPDARFVAVGKGVMQGAEFCATARSHTFAKRIARALNRHKPTREGV